LLTLLASQSRGTEATPPLESDLSLESARKETASDVATKRPEYFVRIINKRRAEAIELLHRLMSTTENSDADVGELEDLFLEDAGVANSVYSAETQESFDLGQAMAVVACAFGQKQLSEAKISAHRDKVVNAYLGKVAKPDLKVSDQFDVKCISVTVHKSAIGETDAADKTPDQNKQFGPACDYHYDIKVVDRSEFILRLIRQLRSSAAVVCVMEKSGFQTRAGIALSHCIKHLHPLSESLADGRWPRLGEEPAIELNRLRAIAGEFGFEARLNQSN